MRKKLLIVIFLLSVMISGLYANDSSKLRCYLSTDIPIYYMDFANTDNPDDFYWGTGIIPSGLNLDVGLMYGVLGFSASAEFSFTGESSGNSAFGVGDFFHLDIRVGPELSARTGKHMFTANFSFEFEYWKELHGAEMTAATSYDETYETTQIETNRTAHRMSFLQFLRYSYFVTNGFGIGPKLVFAERTEGGFMFSVNFNFIYVF